MAPKEPVVWNSFKRKRASVDEVHDTQAKKQRGRPRVQKKDETAADRRRTQIRLAQRAYRSRKETTIASLKSNAMELKEIIYKMNFSFLALKHTATSNTFPKLDSALAEAFKTASENFMTFSERANEISMEQAEAVDESRKSKSKSPPARETSKQLIVRQTSRWMENYPTPSPTMSESERHAVNIWGYQIQNDEEDEEDGLGAIHSVDDVANTSLLSRDQLSVINALSGMATDTRLPGSLPGSPSFDAFPFNYSSLDSINLPLSPPIELPAPFTYSFQETTFARRLHRASLETCYHALTQGKVNPKKLEKALQLSFLFESKQTIAEKVKEVLRRPTTESLEFNRSPFLQIGGAGTHYPRTDEFGNAIKIHNTYEIQSLGPRNISTFHNNTDPLLFPDFPLDLTDLQGDFYDPYDVEGYLQKRGLSINPQDSFAEGDLVDLAPKSPQPLSLADAMSAAPIGSPSSYFSSSSDSTGSDSNSSSSSSSLFQPPTPDAQAFSSVHSFDSGAFDADVLASVELGLPSPQASSWLAPVPAQPQPQSRQISPPRHVVVDVQKLIDGLIKRAKCLGRTPGYRPRDVDEALSRAIVGF